MKTILTIIALLITLQNPCYADESTQLNVKDFGAVGDGVAMDTVALQSAIDACSKAGNATLRVPPGKYQTGTLHLKSNVTLSLDHGAYILGSQNIADYPIENLRKSREGNAHCLLYAEDASNITIEGLGVIDGRGTPDVFPRSVKGKKGRLPRPRLMRLENCQNLTFSGVTYKRPAFWGLHLVDCKDVHFNGVKTLMRNNGANNDGLDIDGCENVLIENCEIVSGDDAICLKSTKNACRNIKVRNCRVSSNTAAFKCGTSSRGGFIDISVDNCYFYDCPMGAIKLQIVDGGTLDNIEISRITMERVGCPIFLRLGNRGRKYNHETKETEGVQGADAKSEGAPIGTFKNVFIHDIVATVTIEDRNKAAEATYKNKKVDSTTGVTDAEKSRVGPIMIAGIPDHYIEDVVLEDIEISYPGKGTAADAQNEVPEDIARYPEQYFFGVLPSWGAYIRHAKNVQFKNVKMTTRSPDEREEIIMEDVQGFVSGNE